MENVIKRIKDRERKSEKDEQAIKWSEMTKLENGESVWNGAGVVKHNKCCDLKQKNIKKWQNW